MRERIIAGSAELFKKYGVKTVTMDDISRQMGISKRTIYENFKDKDELLAACLDYLHDLQDKTNKEIIAQSANTIESIFRLMDQGISAMKSVNPSFYSDIKKYHPQIWDRIYLKKKGKVESETKKILHKGIEEQVVRDDINVDIVCKLLHEQLKILSNEEIFPPEKFDRIEVFENIIINFTKGIATEKGLGTIDDLIGQYLKK